MQNREAFTIKCVDVFVWRPWYVEQLLHVSSTLKSKDPHGDNFVTTGPISGCHGDNPHSSQWGSSNRFISQIPQCIRQISHNAPLCNRNVHISVTKWCIVGREDGALWDKWDRSIVDTTLPFQCMCIQHIINTNIIWCRKQPSDRLLKPLLRNSWNSNKMMNENNQ